MRKIFSMIMVALAALFVATSCELASGTDPNPNRANNLLWNRVYTAINLHFEHFLAVAYLNDTLLGKEVDNGGYEQTEVVVNGNIYTINYGSTYYARSYRIKTDGKRLDEGGEWTIYYRKSIYEEYGKLGMATGIEGESSKFKLSIDNSVCASHYYAYSYAAESEMEYWYDDVQERRCVKYNTFKGTSSDTSGQKDYMISFEVVEPLVIRASIEEGKIDILYNDNVENTSRSLSVVIVNRSVTFVTTNGSNW